MFPKKEREGNVRGRSLVCKHFVQEASNQKNREPGNERVNRPVTRIVISRRKALEKNQNKTKTCKQTLDARCLRTTKRINKIKNGERMCKVTRKMERNSFCFKFAFWFGLRTVFKRRQAPNCPRERQFEVKIDRATTQNCNAFQSKTKRKRSKITKQKFVAVSTIQIFSLKFVDNLENVVKKCSHPAETKFVSKTLGNYSFLRPNRGIRM